jgi:hypothetical protein
MRVYLLLEGSSDEALLQRLIPSEILSETTIVIAGGRSNITSKARSLMVTKRRPLVMITDADTVEKDAVAQRLKTLEDLISSATAGVPYRVILAIPEMESWFFMIPDFVERVTGKRLSPDQRELAKMKPKEVLTELFKDHGSFSFNELASQMTDSEAETLRETDPIREVIDFLTEQVNKQTEPQLTY